MKTMDPMTRENLPISFASIDSSDQGWGSDPAAIPELQNKEKEKERKGAGAPWLFGSAQESSSLVIGSGGARIGASFTSSGFLGSARIAATLSRFFGGSSTFLGGLFASKLGSVLVLAGMAAWAGLILAAAVKLLGVMPEQAGPIAVPAPGGVGPSGIVIDGPKDNSLLYVASANQGEISWDKSQEQRKDAPAPVESKVEPPPVPEPTPEEKKVEMPDVNKLWDSALRNGGLKGDGFLKKLTNDPGMLHGGGMGGLRDALGGVRMAKTFGPSGMPKPVELGKTKSMKRAMQALRAGHKSYLTASAQRAMGQLKFSKGMSMSANRAQMDTQAKQYATDAFDQGKSIGGNLQGLDNGSGIVVPPGNGAPGVTDVEPETPDVPPGANVTPYQPQVDDARNKDNSSSGLKIMGMMLLAIGAVLLAIGMALMGNPFTAMIGAILMGIGIALIAAGIACLMMSASQANAAKGQGQQIQQQYGQNDQGDVLNQCADQASGGGINSDACQTGTAQEAGDKAASNDVHGAVQEEANSTFLLEGDGGNGGGGAAAGAGAGGGGAGRDGAGLR